MKIKHIERETFVLREPPNPKKHRGVIKLLRYVLIVSACFIFFVNPMNLTIVSVAKNWLSDLASNFSKDQSTITILPSASNTEAFTINNTTTITDKTSALYTISSYDAEFGGKFELLDTELLSSGNTVYNFSQISDGIPIFKVGKQLIIDSKKTTRYILGSTVDSHDIPKTPIKIISTAQAEQSVKKLIKSGSTNIRKIEKYWYNCPWYSEHSKYSLVYAVIGTISYNGEKHDFIAMIDAINGNFVDVVDETIDNAKISDELNSTIKSSNKINSSDFEKIVVSTQRIVSLSSNNNPWLYGDVLTHECESYYLNNGNSAQDASKKADIVRKKIGDLGLMIKEPDVNAVKVDTKDSKAVVIGKVNCPNDNDTIIVSHKAGTSQKYTIKTNVPVNVIVSNSAGEMLLNLPVNDEENFDIYPTEKDDTYIITIQSSKKFGNTKEFNFFGLTAYAAETDPDTHALIDEIKKTALGEYALAITQINEELRVPTDYKPLENKLHEIEICYNEQNAFRFLSLWRYDDIGKMIEELLKKSNVFYSADDINMMLSSRVYLALFSHKVANTFLGQPSNNNKVSELKSELSEFKVDSVDKFWIFFYLTIMGGIDEHSFAKDADIRKLKDTSLSFSNIVPAAEIKDGKTAVRTHMTIKNVKTGKIFVDTDIILWGKEFTKNKSSWGKGTIFEPIINKLTSGWFLTWKYDISTNFMYSENHGPTSVTTRPYVKGRVDVSPKQLALFAEMSYFPFSLNYNDYKGDAKKLFKENKGMIDDFRNFKKNVIDVENTGKREDQYIQFSDAISGWTYYTNAYIHIGGGYAIAAVYVNKDTVILAFGGDKNFDWCKAAKGIKGIIEGELWKVLGAGTAGTLMSIENALNQILTEDTGDFQIFINKMFGKNGELSQYKHIYITGHSVGGFIGMYAADMIYQTNFAGRIDGIATFNSMPLTGINGLKYENEYNSETFNYFMKDAEIKENTPDSFDTVDWFAHAFEGNKYIGTKIPLEYKNELYEKPWYILTGYPHVNSIERFYQPLATETSLPFTNH